MAEKEGGGGCVLHARVLKNFKMNTKLILDLWIAKMFKKSTKSEQKLPLSGRGTQLSKQT